MNSFADIAPGAAWSPEPAARYNAVNDLLRRFDDLGAGAPGAALALRGAATVTVVYTGDSSLPAYSLLAISGAATILTSGGAITANPVDPADTLLVAPSAAVVGDTLYGVAQSPVKVGGGAVPVVIAGITPVRVASGAVVSGGEILAPLSGGMAALGDGRVTALCGGVPVGSGGEILAPVLLGGGGGGGVTLAAVVTMPTSAGGDGTISPVTIGSDDALTPTSGASISVKFPFLDGYN